MAQTRPYFRNERELAPLYLVADLASSLVSLATLAAFSDCFLRISLISVGAQGTSNDGSEASAERTNKRRKSRGRTAVSLLENLLRVVAALGREVAESLEVRVLEHLYGVRSSA